MYVIFPFNTMKSMQNINNYLHKNNLFTPKYKLPVETPKGRNLKKKKTTIRYITKIISLSIKIYIQGQYLLSILKTKFNTLIDLLSKLYNIKNEIKKSIEFIKYFSHDSSILKPKVILY